MILFGLSFLLLIVFLYDTKYFIYALLLFFVFFDMFDGFYKDDKIYAAIRYAIPLALILIYVFKYNMLKQSDFILSIAIVYLLLLWLITSADPLIAGRGVLSVIITLLLIPIGKHIAKSTDFIKDFEGYNRVLLIIIPIYIIIANIFKIGESYTEAFSTGFLVTSRMYVVPIVVFLGLHYAITNKNRSLLIKVNDTLFIIINIALLIVNTRRTTLAMLVGAILIYTLLNRRLIFKMAMLVIVAIAALILSYPLYEDKLAAQLEKRERIQEIDSYEEEGRYLETLYIIDYHQKQGNVMELLFGVKLFDTYDFGTRYFGRDRPIHSDINMFFYSTGLIGTFIFAILFAHYFLMGNRRLGQIDRSVYYPILFMFAVILIPGRFIGTLTFAPLLMILLSSIKYKETTEDFIDNNSQLPIANYVDGAHNLNLSSPVNVTEMK